MFHRMLLNDCGLIGVALVFSAIPQNTALNPPQDQAITSSQESDRAADSLPETSPTPSVEERLTRLESRIDALERIVFATAKISAMEADRRVQEAEAQRRESRQLFLKGIIAEGRYRQDEFMVELLRRERDFLLDTARQRKNVMEMELLQAENNLRIAEDQLIFLQTLGNRGFSTIDQVRETERYVIESKARLALAKEKLQAAEELDAITNNRPPPPPHTNAPSKAGENNKKPAPEKTQELSDKDQTGGNDQTGDEEQSRDKEQL
jgi:hypothetical protein